MGVGEGVADGFGVALAGDFDVEGVAPQRRLVADGGVDEELADGVHDADFAPVKSGSRVGEDAPVVEGADEAHVGGGPGAADLEEPQAFGGEDAGQGDRLSVGDDPLGVGAVGFGEGDVEGAGEGGNLDELAVLVNEAVG